MWIGFIRLNPLEVGMLNLKLEITTNLINTVFCISDTSYLILSTQKNNNVALFENKTYIISCDNLLPMERYSVSTTLGCDFQKTTIETSEFINTKRYLKF